jgi:hypothetical protein
MYGGHATAARARVGRSALATAAVLACALTISACGSSGDSTAKYLDMARVERAIERSIYSQRHLKSKIVCPEKVPQKPGKFACIATTTSTKKPHKKIKTPFVVTVHNTSGYVTYIGK